MVPSFSTTTMKFPSDSVRERRTSREEYFKAFDIKFVKILSKCILSRNVFIGVSGTSEVKRRPFFRAEISKRLKTAETRKHTLLSSGFIS